MKNDDSQTYDELVDLEKQIEYTVGTANAGSMIQTTVLGLSTLLENKGPSFGINLQGYSSLLMTNENFKKTLLELECIYGGKHTSSFKYSKVKTRNESKDEQSKSSK